MNQSGILRHCYETIFNILKTEGERSKLYTVLEGGINEYSEAVKPKTSVYLEVSDIAQTRQDKNGEKVFIGDEQFPSPTYMACIFTIGIAAEQYTDALEASGCIVRYFKDNNFFEAGEYNWHGNTSNTVYVEAFIREPDINRTAKNASTPFVSLDYRIEAALNSEKGEVFKRVQSRDIKAVNKEQ